MTATQHVNVHVTDRLSTIRALVDNEPKTAGTSFVADGGGNRKDFCDQLRARLFCELRRIRVMLHRDYEGVERRLRRHVLDGKYVAAAVQGLRGNRACRDFAKNARIVRSAHDLGLKSSKFIAVSGFGTNPAIDDFTTIGTVV